MKCIETLKHPKTSWESQAGDCGLVSHVWVLNATCTMTFYVYFSPYRNLVSIILSPVLLFCSSIASFFSCSLKSQRRMPDRRLAPDPRRKRLITTSKAVESRCCSRVEVLSSSRERIKRQSFNLQPMTAVYKPIPYMIYFLGKSSCIASRLRCTDHRHRSLRAT